MTRFVHSAITWRESKPTAHGVVGSETIDARTFVSKLNAVPTMGCVRETCATLHK